MSIAGKNVMITGATGGLGQALATAFWQAQANLYLLGRDEKKLAALQDTLESLQPNVSQKVHYFIVDWQNTAALNAFTQQLREQAWPIDVLITSAGIQGDIELSWEVREKIYEAVLAVNLLAPMSLSNAVIPGMLQRGFGRIIHLAGGGAANARPYFAAYAASKAGLVRFAETQAKELAETAVTVNCIAPGLMKTEMLEEMLAAGKEKFSKEEYQNLLMMKDSQDHGYYAPVQLCLYLASETASFIRGKLIAALWDDWQHFSSTLPEDLYTLRRVTNE